MKTNLLYGLKIFLCSILFLNCNKEVSELSKYQKEQNAINEIRNILSIYGYPIFGTDPRVRYKIRLIRGLTLFGLKKLS